jgi:Pentapeptide repeats (8 copies)
MANAEHLAQLMQGVAAWNAWREENPDVCPDLKAASLSGVVLSFANLSRADLSRANLSEAHLNRANLYGAGLFRANLGGAQLNGANLGGANLSEAVLGFANLIQANLSQASLYRTDLSQACLYGANLSRANLSGVSLVKADLRDADLTSCIVFGISAWKLKLEGAKQESLVITDYGEPEITVDNIEVAQFIYLLLNNPKIRDVIDTIGNKAVLILGRFTPERKKVLDTLREELRKRGYLPILFDFEKPTSKDLTETVLTLARMARFIIADLSDLSCIPYEVSKVPDAFVPVQPILLAGKSEFAMFADLQRRHHWVLPTHRYDSQEQLIAGLNERVIGPAERKVLELRGGAKEVP